MSPRGMRGSIFRLRKVDLGVCQDVGDQGVSDCALMSRVTSNIGVATGALNVSTNSGGFG